MDPTFQPIHPVVLALHRLLSAPAMPTEGTVRPWLPVGGGQAPAAPDQGDPTHQPMPQAPQGNVVPWQPVAPQQPPQGTMHTWQKV